MDQDQNVIRRAWLYCDECPEGKIFKGEEIDDATDEGWVDSPEKIGTEDDGPEQGIVEGNGGWFTVTHGAMTEKVQGRDNAEAKLAEMQANSE